jgi:hypothetical protein
VCGREKGTVAAAAPRRTTHGVRRWPLSVRTHTPVREQMSFTVWSPLRAAATEQQTRLSAHS